MKYWLIVLVLSLLPLGSLFFSGLPETHDGQDHVARIANFSASLSEGNVVPRWAANLNWGYGHPILMFLYPLPSYMASLFHVIGFSFVDSTKLVFGVSYVLSLLTMYLWMSTVWGPRAGVVAAVLYGFSPYRFVDLYVRGAIGEHVAFIFPPLIFFFLYRLATGSHTRIYATGLSIALAMLVLSHNAISLMFAPFIVLYSLYVGLSIKKSRVSFFITAVLSLCIGLGLSAFFWVPAFFEGKYTLRDILLSDGIGLDRFVPMWHFIYSPWNYGIGSQITKEVGVGHWIIVGTFLILIGKFTKHERILGIGLVTALLLSLFLQTQITKPIWDAVSIIQKFQFPWRLLTVSLFLPAVLSGMVISYCEKQKKLSTLFKAGLISLVLLTILSTTHMWKPKGYESHAESFYSGIYEGTTDTGESSPIWSERFMEHRSDYNASIVSGTGSLFDSRRTTTVRQYKVDAESEVRIVESTLYFPGWKVYIDGKETNIQYQDPEFRGLMTFIVPAGEHTIDIRFTDTKLRLAAGILSIVSAIFLVVWLAKR